MRVRMWTLAGVDASVGVGVNTGGRDASAGASGDTGVATVMDAGTCAGAGASSDEMIMCSPLSSDEVMGLKSCSGDLM